MTNADKAVVRCPRCGYDQAGLTESWEQAGVCPVEGRCPECGQGWWWGDLLNPTLTMPAWLFEHAERRRAVRALVGTWRKALWPRRFWVSMRPQYPVRVQRLLEFVLVCVAATWAVLALSGLVNQAWGGFWNGGGGASRDQSAIRMCLADAPEWMVCLIWPLGDGGAYDKASAKHWLMLVGVWTALTPVVFLLLGQNIRREHLVRSACYSVAPLGLVVGLIAPWRTMPSMFVDCCGMGTGVMFWLFSREEAIIVPLWGVWMSMWWYEATRRYLKLPHPAATTALALMVAFFVAAAIAAYFPGSVLLFDVTRWITGK